MFKGTVARVRPSLQNRMSAALPTGTVIDSIPRLLRSLRYLLFRKQKVTEQTERAKKGIQFPHLDLTNIAL
jgi:microcompartment protein CcmL/EutN